MKPQPRSLLEKLREFPNPTMTVDEARGFYGLGRNAAYDAVHEGQIPSKRIGGKIVVPTIAVQRDLGVL